MDFSCYCYYYYSHGLNGLICNWGCFVKNWNILSFTSFRYYFWKPSLYQCYSNHFLHLWEMIHSRHGKWLIQMGQLTHFRAGSGSIRYLSIDVFTLLWTNKQTKVVFCVFSTELLPSPCKNTESGSLSSSIDFFVWFHIVCHRYASK